MPFNKEQNDPNLESVVNAVAELYDCFSTGMRDDRVIRREC